MESILSLPELAAKFSAFPGFWPWTLSTCFTNSDNRNGIGLSLLKFKIWSGVVVPSGSSSLAFPNIDSPKNVFTKIKFDDVF